MQVEQTNWLAILEREVARTNKQQVANVVGVSRTAISLALAGKYRGSTDNLEKAVLEAYQRDVECPYLKGPIRRSRCEDFQNRPIPQSNAAELKHWRHCRSCHVFLGRTITVEKGRCEDA